MWAYTLGIWLYGLFLRIAAWVHPKARDWVTGRKHLLRRLETQVANLPPQRIWMHCASLGEFEQGRPVLEALARSFPEHAVVVSFFSPSGFNVRQNYSGADLVVYLPLDLPRNARRFVRLLQPEMALFVKYDLWLHTLAALRAAAIPTLLISARPRPDSAWFRWPLRRYYQEALRALTHIFVQDQPALECLENHVPGSLLQLSGDTRYDRVLATRARFEPLPEIEAFVQSRPCLVGGSIWPADEEVLMPVLLERLQAEPDRCAILAPHDIHPEKIDAWIARFPDVMIRYAEMDQRRPGHRILWIDNVGMLSRLYAYADIAYIGGAFGKGLHNILEAAVFGVPVLFGPRIHRFPEAGELIRAGGGFVVHNSQDIRHVWDGWDTRPGSAEEAGSAAAQMVENKAGATSRILDFITQKGLVRSV